MQIFRRAAAEGAYGAEHDACERVALKSGFLEPCEGSGLVVRYAFRAEIQIGEVVLGLWLAAFGRSSDGVVLNHAEAVLVHVAQIQLRRSVAAARTLVNQP